MSFPRRSAATWSTAGVLACVILAIAGLASADEPAGPGGDHLVVSRIPTLSTSQAVTLVRFNGAGTSDGANWALPATASGSNHPFTLQGDSNAVGSVALSADGRYLTLAGYTTAVGGNPEAADARDVARVNAVGTADTSTTLGKTFLKEKIRGAVTDDGTRFWVTGNGNGSGNTPLGGMIYAPLGSTSPAAIFSREVPVSSSNKALNNTRTVQIAGGNIYTGSEKGTAGIYTLTGLPTTPQSPANPISFSGEIDPISELPLEHVAGSKTVDLMYVVKEGEGIVKYSLSGSSWVSRGTLVSGNFAGVTGRVDSEGHFRIYAIQGYNAGNAIVTLTDNAAFNAAPSASSLSTVSTAPAGTVYRGIAFAPHDASLEVPGAPTGVSATAGDEKATLTWTKPSEEGGSVISAYRITPFISGVAQTPITTPTAATSYTVEGLTNGTAYTFTVAAINSSGAGPDSSPSAPVTPKGASKPTIEQPEYFSGVIEDPTNPQLTVIASQAGVDPEELSVEYVGATNSPVSGVVYETGSVVNGDNLEVSFAIEPQSVGYSDMTFRVWGAGGTSSTTAVVHYAASAASPTPADSRFFSGAADASTAIDVGGGYILVGDDENNTLRLYRSEMSGAPVKTWSFGAQMGGPEEVDIEAAARSGNTIYWTGSMGNSKKGNLKPDRSILFTTHLSGSGADTELTFGGYYRGLRGDLIKWDEENGDRFGFAAGAASGNIPKQIDGFNAEGLELAPGSSSTAYLGFRAPLSPATPGGDAIVVPVTNLDQLATSGQNTSIHASFGEPILMDLDGLSVREIRKNADDEYLIIAGSWAAGGEQAIFSWDGVPADPPVRSPTTLPLGAAEGEDAGAWEAIAAVPDPFPSGSSVQLVMDNGSTDLYGDGQEAKELVPEFQKSRADYIPVYLPGGPFNTSLPTISSGNGVGDLLTCSPGDWSGEPTLTYSYHWLRNNWEVPNETDTYEVVPKDRGKSLRCVVSVENSLGFATATSEPTVIASDPRCTGTDIVGAGSSMQAIDQLQVWKPAFEDTTCDKGTHPSVDYEDIGSAAGMREWNFDGSRGSINTDLAFIGTDAPPTKAQIANIEGVAHGARLAVLPVAQTAIAILANPPAGCDVEAITNSNLAGVFEGRIREWSKLEGVEGKCNSPITRVVRRDGAGTTLQFKNYLDVLYSKGLACTTGGNEGKMGWDEMEPIGVTDAPNTSWPESCSEKALSPVIRPAGAGGAQTVQKVNSTPGSIGYAALPEAKAGIAGGTEILELQDNGQKKIGEANFAKPSLLTAANCSGITYKGAKLHLTLENKDWSNVFGAVPAVGAKNYPLCMLTYVLAFHGYRAAGFSLGQEITARDYLMSGAGGVLNTHYYSSIPAVIGSEPGFEAAEAMIGW